MDLDNIQRKYGLPAPLPVVQNGKFATRFPLNLEHRGDDVFQFGGKYIGEIENIYDLLYKILTNQEIDASLALPYAIKITEDKLYIRDKTNSEWILIFDITKPNFPKEIELYELIYKAITHQVIGEDTSYPGQFKIEENILYVRDKDNLIWTQIGDVTKEFLGATEATQAILDQVNEILTEVQELKTELNRQIATTNETLTTALQAANEAMTSAQSINIRTFNSVEEMKASNTLKEGALAKTLGFYTAGDGGGADYVVTDNIDEDEADEASIITLKKGLYAKLLVQDYLNVKKIGAKGDGKIDDTEALQKAINFCKNNNNVSVLLLPEGNYKTTDTLNIYLDKFTLKGNGNANIIPYMDSSTALVFTMVKDVIYADRYLHNRKNSGFSVLGQHTTNTTLISVGDGEKSVNCAEWENIVLEGATTLLHCKAHTYKNNFTNVIFNSSINVENSLIYDSVDTGEATNFIGCSFWTGKILCNTECFFMGCTIHLKPEKINCNGGHMSFSNCHFEVLNAQSLNNNETPFIMANDGQIFIDNCTMGVSDSIGYTIKVPLFKAVSNSTARVGKIVISSSNLIGFLYNLKGNKILCDGNVIIRGTPTILKFDLGYLPSKVEKIYSYTDLDIYKNIKTWEQEKEDSATEFTWDSETGVITTTGGLLNRYITIPIPNNVGAVNFICSFESNSELVVQGGNDMNYTRGIGFTDALGKVIPQQIGDGFYTKFTPNSNTFRGIALPIPPNALYLRIGIATVASGATNIKVKEFGYEFF